MKFRTESVTRSPVSAYLPHGVLALGIAVIGLSMASSSRGWHLPVAAAALESVGPEPQRTLESPQWPPPKEIRVGEKWPSAGSKGVALVTGHEFSPCSSARGVLVVMDQFRVSRAIVVVRPGETGKWPKDLRDPRLTIVESSQDDFAERVRRTRQPLLLGPDGRVLAAGAASEALGHFVARHGAEVPR